MYVCACCLSSGYDGGDCCSCTCVAPADDDRNTWYADDDYTACGNGFACIDPEAECVDDDDITTGVLANCDSVSVGDGYCNVENNVPECGA